MVPAMDRFGERKIRIELTLRRSSLRGGLALRDRCIAALDIAAPPAIDMQADGIIRRIGLRRRGRRRRNRSNRKHRKSQNTHRIVTFGSRGRTARCASMVATLEQSLHARQGVVESLPSTPSIDNVDRWNPAQSSHQVRLLHCGRAGAVTTLRPEIVMFWFRCCELPQHLKGFQESQKCPIGKVKLHQCRIRSGTATRTMSEKSELIFERW